MASVVFYPQDRRGTRLNSIRSLNRSAQRRCNIIYGLYFCGSVSVHYTGCVSGEQCVYAQLRSVWAERCTDLYHFNVLQQTRDHCQSVDSQYWCPRDFFFYFSVFLVHGQVTIIFVVSVGLSVCLSVCLFVCAEFFSAVFDPISIKLGHMLYVWVYSCVP